MENPHFSAQRSHKIPKQVSIYFFFTSMAPMSIFGFGVLRTSEGPASSHTGRIRRTSPSLSLFCPHHLRSCNSQFLASRPVSFLKKKLYPLGFSKKSKPFINVVMERKNIPLGSEMNLQSYYFSATTLANPFFTLSPTHPFSECTDRISLNFEFF